ncbi:sensor histidine kinase [Aquilutibacter rugosus]|uniref:sensor histidine kinase n=1 Tax=Aquilutibacter rugosus TaxID=3115820 RepID=UPI002F403DC4
MTTVSQRSVPFFRSIAWRLALAAMALVMLSTLSLYALTASSVRTQALQSVESNVNTDMAGLADLYAAGGKDELMRRIAERLQYANPNDRAVYRLDENGRQLVGNLEQWPPLDARRSEFGTLDDRHGHEISGRVTQLSPELRLFVGRQMQDLQSTLGALRRTFLLAGIGVSLMALLLGYWRSRRLADRLDRIEELHLRAARGEPAIANAMSEHGDELDVLGHRTQTMLQRQVDLVNRYRESSEHAAHEIRSPLLHLDTKLHRVLEQSADPRVQETLAQGRADIRSIVRLLESLLDISAAQAHLGDISDFESVDLSALVLRMVEIYADTAEDQGYSLQAQIQPDLFIYGNALQLERIVSNLLDNALKFSPAGSRIEIKLSQGPRLLVADDGPGVPKEMRRRIFERFGRSDDVVAKGHGLGLPLAQAFAARHGLQIRLLDTEHGASFEMAPVTELA